MKFQTQLGALVNSFVHNGTAFKSGELCLNRRGLTLSLHRRHDGKPVNISKSSGEKIISPGQINSTMYMHHKTMLLMLTKTL